MKSQYAKLLLGFCAFSMTVALAQPRRGPMHYDASKEITVSGTIDDVQEIQHNRMTGIHVLVKTENGTVDVHLGPAFFIKDQGFTFAKGDQVEIVGAKAKMAGADIVIAREVNKEGKQLTLRDASGRPKWAGRRT
jgi:DNA/RNA endonuclease YhcR with UshA esterase domain